MSDRAKIEAIASIPWRIQQLENENEWEHRVRVVTEILEAAEAMEQAK